MPGPNKKTLRCNQCDWVRDGLPRKLAGHLVEAHGLSRANAAAIASELCAVKLKACSDCDFIGAPRTLASHRATTCPGGPAAAVAPEALRSTCPVILQDLSYEKFKTVYKELADERFIPRIFVKSVNEMMDRDAFDTLRGPDAGAMQEAIEEAIEEAIAEEADPEGDGGHVNDVHSSDDAPADQQAHDGADVRVLCK